MESLIELIGGSFANEEVYSLFFALIYYCGRWNSYWKSLVFFEARRWTRVCVCFVKFYEKIFQAGVFFLRKRKLSTIIFSEKKKSTKKFLCGLFSKKLFQKFHEIYFEKQRNRKFISNFGSFPANFVMIWIFCWSPYNNSTKIDLEFQSFPNKNLIKKTTPKWISPIQARPLGLL